MNELQERINEIINLDEARYFYHLTSKNGEDILEDGLFVASPDWENSFLEFTEEEINNISELLDNNNSKFRSNHTLLIAGIYKEDINYLIRPLKEGEKSYIDFEGVGNPDYIVDPEYLVGYIDMDTKELYINERAKVSDYFEL